MTKQLVIFTAIALTLVGCATPVPVRPVWPDAPTEIQQQCLPLRQLETGATLKDLMMTVIENYAAYHHCASKTQTWQDWHREHKKIYEGIK